MSELERNVRQIVIEGSICEIRLMLDMLVSMMNEPGPLAAAARASSVRTIIEAAEELKEMTG